jgi:4-amino-4-deoxy-L-arabinose transferase-like glycosyltransferase
VYEVLQGARPIFFSRNTGREAIQFYLTAGVASLFGTGLTHISLKIGTILAGLLTLPFIYLTGKEIANWRAGLLAAFFAGIAYWPNVIARVGLRFPLYPLFVAPALYFLIRGLRRGTRNDFILSGIALGIGLHGYTPIRILPFAILVAVALFWLHTRSGPRRSQAVWGLIIVGVVALVCFLPLLRFAQENPSLFNYRAFSRVTNLDQPLPGPAWLIFLENLWRALTMFAWDNGEIWVISLPHRPALDLVSSALFHLGVVLLVLRWQKKRQWLDLFLLVSIPILMLPSILSLAFPAENPALNRASGAIVPVFLIVGLAADSLINSLGNLGNATTRRWWISAAWGGLLLVSAGINYDLVFNQYYQLYAQSSWNTSEMGKVVENFASTIGSPETTWVMAYPHWVDTRLVGIQAGQDVRDMAMSIDRLETTRQDPRPKLFVVNPLDVDGLDALQHIYAQGWVQEYQSAYENKNFLLYFVPPGD